MGNHDQDDVVRRLRSLGSQPVEPGVADRHASYLAAAAPAAARRRRRPAVTAAFVAGIILGGTGLAAAVPGPLPTQAASVASKALNAVNPANGPKDPVKAAAKAQAKAGRATAKAARLAAKLANGQGVERYYVGCTGLTPPYNHGQYVKAHPDLAGTAANERQLAAESRCGKPVQAGTNTATAGAEEDKGKPTNPGKSEDSNKPAVTGQPASPGKSDATHPPETAEADEAPESPGKSEENRPEDAGPPSSTGS